MLKVAIIGASGYTGQELIRLLLRHPNVEITALTSRKFDGMKVAEVFRTFASEIDLTFTAPSPNHISNLSDLIICALPHKAAMNIVPELLKSGKKVIDLSADFRFNNPEVYEKWYSSHTCPGLLKESVYGLPELYRDQIRKANLVANPGCYPTSAILGLAPLLKNRIIDVKNIVVDSKSGVSGAGRTVAMDYLFCEVNEGLKAYKIGEHRHTPEIEQELSLLAHRDVIVSFTPHLIPIDRGILSTIYSNALKDTSIPELTGIYIDFYSKERFVRIHTEDSLPNISFVKGSNFCDIGVRFDPRTKRIVVISAIDNLVKGASGQAIQDMNIMYGFPEDSGIGNLPLFP